MGPSFVESLPVDRFHGVGPATAAKMKALGIFTALDLRAKDEAFLSKHFGKAGRHFYCICRGIDLRPVLPNRVRKSVGAENTFSHDLTSLDDMRAELDPLVEKVWHYCDTTGVRGRTVTLKVKFADFGVITRSRSRLVPVLDRSTTGINQRRVARGSVSDRERSSSARCIALFAVRRCGGGRYANDAGIVNTVREARQFSEPVQLRNT